MEQLLGGNQLAGKKKQNSISINQYKTKRELNIGTVIFALVFIYLVVAVVAYATDKKINIYEVREGGIFFEITPIPVLF